MPLPVYQTITRAGIASAIILGTLALNGAVEANQNHRLAKADRLSGPAIDPCVGQTWPRFSDACLSSIMKESGKLNRLRMITVEKRDAANNTSVLYRTTHIR